MKRLLTSISILLFSCFFLWGCKGDKDIKEIEPTKVPIENNNTEDIENNTENNNEGITGVINETILYETNYFDEQKLVNENLQKEMDKGYTFDNALVIVNPYGNSPLTAVAIFTTETEMGGTITIKGKEKEDNITGKLESSTSHIVPIYGLYSGGTTEVEIVLDDGRNQVFEVVTDSVPASAEGIEIKMSDSSAYDYSNLTFISNATDECIYAVDSKGDIRWYYDNSGALGVKVLTNGHLIVPTKYTLKPLYYKSGIKEIDLLGKVYYEYAIPGGMHHDIVELSNGNLLIAADRPDFETVEDYIVEINKETGEVVWELDLTTLIDPAEGGSVNQTTEDWFHNNGLWYDEASDTILLSGRHIDAIVAVDKSDKKLKWILGDKEGWSEEYDKYFFTPKGDNFEWQYAQHQVTMLSNGDIMCFDNGAGRTKTSNLKAEVTGNDVYSRAVIYRIDEDNMTIEQVWQYGKELGGEYYSEWISGAISLNDDPNNIWITFGANLYNPEEDSYDYGPADMFMEGIMQTTKIVQVKGNKPVYNMKLNHLTYRSFRSSLYENINNFDIKAEGKYLGSLGTTKPLDINIELSNAQNTQSTINLDPTKLTLSTSYTIPSKEELEDSYFVLRKEDGTTMAYKTEQTLLEKENEVTVQVTGWISTTGLEGAAYDVYVSLGGTVYNTGYRVELK